MKRLSQTLRQPFYSRFQNSADYFISVTLAYFMALKDDAGLVKMYGMVNIQKYQWVATGNTIKECEKAYSRLLNSQA